MLRQLFGFGTNTNQAAVDALYAAIVAAARQPTLYSAWGVADTLLGRFEMLALHMFVLLHRLRGETAAQDLGQGVTDEFFQDVDHSLRELGIGDLGIPKRMKKLAGMFYGRARAYGGALDARDRDGLAAALKRNVAPGRAEWDGAGPLADYVFRAHEDLAGQPVSELLTGALRFPVAQAADRGVI
jgi:cytochrome b pre-mRNA-processing protein 3